MAECEIVEQVLRLAGAGGDALRALLAQPAVAGEEPRRGVVVIHGARGLDAQARAAAQRLARAGYAALAPDLRSRAGASSDSFGSPGSLGSPGPPEDEWEAAADLLDRRALSDLEAAAAALVERAGVDPERAAALGFGAGGTLALLFGCASTRVAAAVLFCGRVVYPELSAAKPIQPLELALNLGAPLLACFGERDPSTPPEDVARLRTALSQFSKDFDIVTYPGAAHGFMREGGGGYDAAAAADAWRRALAFLEERLA